jgi:hypothetical protein
LAIKPGVFSPFSCISARWKASIFLLIIVVVFVLFHRKPSLSYIDHMFKTIHGYNLYSKWKALLKIKRAALSCSSAYKNHLNGLRFFSACFRRPSEASPSGHRLCKWHQFCRYLPLQ